MANRTVKDAHTVKGTNPQYLVEKIIRSRIYESKYWKEHCFALSAELLVDKALELRYIGGIYGGNVKPTPFLCLILKMLQIQPEKDIVIEFIKQDFNKYMRALGALYMRLTGTSLDCYKYLEPLYNDYRKIRMQNKNGEFELSHMDEYIDSLLREERMCDVILPRLQKRQVLEENNELDPRVSALEDDLDEADTSDEEGEVKEESKRSPTPTRKRSPQASRRSRSRSPRRRSRSRSRDRHDRHRRSRSRERRRGRSRSPKRKEHRRHKSRSRSRDRRHGGATKDQLDIDEANALRAKLGLAPLRP